MGTRLANLNDAMAAISKQGMILVRRLGLNEQGIGDLYERAVGIFLEMGFHPVRAFVIDDGHVALHEDDLACGDDAHAKIASLSNVFSPLHGDSFRTVDDRQLSDRNDASPTSSERRGTPRPATLYIRCPQHENEHRQLKKVLETFRLDNKKFDVHP
jgi:hypothetical protein